MKSLLLLTAAASAVLGTLSAYFRAAHIEGDVYIMVCACGMKRATIVDGKVVLAEPNHDDPEGTTVATIDIKDQVCTIRLLEEDRSLGRPARYTIDHLGAKWSDAVAGGTELRYILLVDNWKLYPWLAFEWLRHAMD